MFAFVYLMKIAAFHFWINLFSIFIAFCSFFGFQFHLNAKQLRNITIHLRASHDSDLSIIIVQQWSIRFQCHSFLTKYDLNWNEWRIHNISSIFLNYNFALLFREEKNLQIEIWEFHKSIVRRPVVDHWPSSHAQMSLIRHFIVWRINIGNKLGAFIPFQEKKKTIYHSIL